MDFLKKARGHVKVAVKEIHDVAQQGKQQWDARHQQQQHQQYSENAYQQPQPIYQQQQPIYQQQQPIYQQQQPIYQQQQQPYYQTDQHQQPGQFQQPASAQHHQVAPDQGQQYYNQGAYAQQPPQIHHQQLQEQPQCYHPHSIQPQTDAPRQEALLLPTQHQPHAQQIQQLQHNWGRQCLAKEDKFVESVSFYVLLPEVRSQSSSKTLEELELTICDNCFSSHIVPFPNVAGNFVALSVPAPASDKVALISYQVASCKAALPRFQQVIRLCSSVSSVQPLIDDVLFCNSLDTCNGSVQSASVGWWKAQNAGDVAFCNSCFERCARHTAFEGYFIYESGPHEEGDWMCDMGLGGGISEFFNQEVRSTSPDYNRWQSVIADIAAAPHCPGEGVPLEQAASGPFYAARNGLAGIFCRACYLGHFLATPLEGTVSETALSPEQLATIPCNAAGSFSQFALKQAIKQEDLALWSRAAVWNAKVPACSGVKGVDETEIQGVQGLSWYKLRDHPNIEVCPSCFHICLELFSLGGLFEPIDRPLVDGFVRQCFMPVNLETDNTSVEDINDFPTTIDWRAKLIREGILFYSASNGDPRVLKGYAEKIASLPPPCFSNSRICFPINRRKWFGRSAQLGDPDDFHFAMCEDCFVNCAKGTPLEHILNGDATAAVNTQEAGFVCQAYSNRTRKVLKEAMQSGNWESFAHHWKTREEVNGRYHAANREAIQMKKVLALKAQVDAEGAMGSIRLMQGLTANTNAIIMGIGGSVAEASATDYGQRYGNSTVGYGYLTQNGANAAMDRQQAQQFAAQMPVKDMRFYQDTGDVISDSFVIGAIVEQVTKEWKAIE